jgi:superfamily I DNA/RNA helicase
LVSRFAAIKEEIAQLETIAMAGNLSSVIDALFPDQHQQTRDLRALALTVLESIGMGDRALFLRELTSAIAKPEIPLEIEDVRIMSLHKSKGLSSPVTIIAGCVDGLLPKQPDSTLPHNVQVAELEEQRRLFFVGITRVKSVPAQGKVGTLILTYAQNMSVADARGAGINPAYSSYNNASLLASRFIAEMAPAAPRATAG